jgi:hypothetical protein
MMLSATFNNISITGIPQRSVVLVEETGKPSNNYRLRKSLSNFYYEYTKIFWSDYVYGQFNVSLSISNFDVVCTVSEMSNRKNVSITAGANQSKSETVLHIWWHCRCLANSHSCFPVVICILPIAWLRSEWVISKAWVQSCLKQTFVFFWFSVCSIGTKVITCMLDGASLFFTCFILWFFF